jgi:hypothetical protein
MEEKQLLIEYLPFVISPQQLQEGFNKKTNNLTVEGVIQRANAKNQNNRIYPREVLLRESETYTKGPIAENRALGELDHPDSSIINLKNVSHNIKKIWWEGDDLMGRIEVLNTPSGNILKTLFTEGVTVGISSRGMGSVKQIGENTVQVQDDFSILCWDFVSTPSTHGSYMRPIKNNSINESFNPSLNTTYKYSRVNTIITEILCNRMGYCPCDLPTPNYK